NGRLISLSPVTLMLRGGRDEAVPSAPDSLLAVTGDRPYHSFQGPCHANAALDLATDDRRPDRRRRADRLAIRRWDLGQPDPQRDGPRPDHGDLQGPVRSGQERGLVARLRRPLTLSDTTDAPVESNDCDRREVGNDAASP